MSLVAIKGIYQNGQITLEEEITAKEPLAVIVTFLEEKKTETVTEFAQWFASMSAFSDDFYFGYQLSSFQRSALEC